MMFSDQHEVDQKVTPKVSAVFAQNIRNSQFHYVFPCEAFRALLNEIRSANEDAPNFRIM